MLDLQSAKSKKTLLGTVLMALVVVAQMVAAKYGVEIPETWITMILGGIGAGQTANILMHGYTDGQAVKNGKGKK